MAKKLKIKRNAYTRKVFNSFNTKKNTIKHFLPVLYSLTYEANRMGVSTIIIDYFGYPLFVSIELEKKTINWVVI